MYIYTGLIKLLQKSNFTSPTLERWSRGERATQAAVTQQLIWAMLLLIPETALYKTEIHREYKCITESK